MQISQKERERQLKFASRQARKEFSYFMKYDELTGVLACPGVKLRSLKQSSFFEDYRDRMNSRLLDEGQEEIDMNFQ